jgi:hypothetical protein
MGSRGQTGLAAHRQPGPAPPATHLQNESRTKLALVLHQRHPVAMKSRAALTAAGRRIGPFQQGQVWKMGDVTLAVTSVGKTLVHYKQYRTQPRGIPIRLSSKPALQKYLLSSKAILSAK